MRRRHLAVLAVLGAAAAFVACTLEDPLNPQPLPPGSGNEAAFDASARTDGGGGFGGGPGPETTADAGSTGAVDGDAGTPPSGEGGADGGTLDAGDGGLDATTDADGG